METKNEKNHFDINPRHPISSSQMFFLRPEFQLEKTDDLEGIINHEPLKNKYEIIKYHQMNHFPFCLVGTIVSKLEIDEDKKTINGVGIFIGPRVVLTVAHNLVHYYKGSVYNAKKVFFNPVANGNFSLCHSIKAHKFYVNEDYIKAVRSDNQRNQIMNDWGLIFFDWDVGDCVINKLNSHFIDDFANLKQINGLYSFFCDDLNDNFLFAAKQLKISIVGYTQYSEATKAYRSTHTNDNNLTDESSSIEGSESSSLICPITNTSSIMTSVNQGKIFAEIVQENKEMYNSFWNFNPNMNNNSESIIKPINVNEEGLILPIQINSKNKKEISFFIFDSKSLSKESEDSSVCAFNALVMTESKGAIINTEKEGLDVLRYRISTYKGQSGSPIFIRIRVNSKEESKAKYYYHFIGLHSRRGPMISLSNLYTKTMNKSFCSNYSTKQRRKASPQKNYFDSNNKAIEFVTYLLQENFAKSPDGICDFNIALGIHKTILNKISSIAREQIRPQIENEFALSSYYYKIHIIVPFASELYTGIFMQTVSLSKIFKLAASIVHVKEDFISLKDQNGNIYSYKFDREKILKEIFENSNEDAAFFFEIEIKLRSYSEHIAATAIDAVCRKNKVDIDMIKSNIVYMTELFRSIFDEIADMNAGSDVYGDLFKKIRRGVLTKLDIIDEC